MQTCPIQPADYRAPARFALQPGNFRTRRRIADIVQGKHQSASECA